MAAMPTCHECAAAKSGRDMHTWSMTCDDASASSVPGHEVSSSDVSTTEVPTSKVRATTEVSATAMTSTVSTTTATSCGSFRRKR